MLYPAYSPLFKMKKHCAYLLIAICALLILFIGYMNVDSLIGAFGNGPPYYGRTTNMDKWENPLPTLIAIDIAALLFIYLIGKWAIRQIK
jgi:hypothetical protein